VRRRPYEPLRVGGEPLPRASRAGSNPDSQSDMTSLAQMLLPNLGWDRVDRVKLGIAVHHGLVGNPAAGRKVVRDALFGATL
jgi:hypothetical protein